MGKTSLSARLGCTWPSVQVIFRGGTRRNLQSATVEILLEVGSACMGELSEEPGRLLELMPNITLDGRVSGDVTATQFQ